MSIGDDLAGALPELQEHAESMMRDRCRIQIPAGGEPVIDAKGAVLRPTTVLAADLPCKQQDNTLQVNDADAAAATVTSIREEIHVPVPGRLGSILVPTGAVIEITASELRPESVGRRVRVTAPHRKTYQTAQRLPVTEDV